MLRFLLVIWALMPSCAYAQLIGRITNAQGYISCNPCGFGAQTGRGFPLPFAQVGIVCRDKTGEPFIVATGMTDARGQFDLKTPDNLANLGLISCWVILLEPHGCTSITAGTPNMCPTIAYAQETMTDKQAFSPAPAPVPVSFPYRRPTHNPFVRSFASAKLRISVISIFSVILFQLLCFFPD